MIALALRVRRAEAEIVLARLLELVPGGMQEREAADDVEYVIYGSAGELPDERALGDAAGDALVAISHWQVDDDWGERWKRWHRPVDVRAAGRHVRVRPPWEPAAGAGAIDVVVDPGQAFGTGGHHTTRLCLELLLERAPEGSLADWGCGSGVLALAAARLGYRPVTAVDSDPAALDATRANAAANGVTALAVRRADLSREPAPPAATVVANLTAPLLLEVARRLRRPPSVLIASGLLRGETGVVAAAFAGHGLRETGRRASGEWAALVLEAG